MDKTCFFLLVLFFAVTESQPRLGFRRCPPPRGAGICASNCQPWGSSRRGCPRGQLCCFNGCAYRCTRPGGPVGPSNTGIPPWCPRGSPRIRCFVNPCNIMRCPRFPYARCRPTNPCEPSCTGAFYHWGRRIPDWLCNSRQRGRV